MNNITVFRAISVLAQACASIEWKVFSKGAKRVEQPNHPVTLLLNQANTDQSRGSFITELVSYWLIGGTNYLMGSFPNNSPFPMALYNLRPDLMEPYYDRTKTLAGWKYSTGETYTIYPLWKIKPIKFFHPLDPLHGLSPIQVAASVIERQNSGEEWNYSLLKNMARPSGAFVANTEFSDESRARLKAEILKKYGRGMKTAGMPMLLENGLTYMQLALSPVDVDWFQSDASAGRKIAAAIGVDPLLLNDKQYSTYNNSTEAKLALWELSGFPLMDTLRDEFNVWLVPFFGRDVEVDYDRRPIEAMKRNRQIESVTTVAEWNNGVRSFNDAATELGLDTIDENNDFYRFGPQLFVKKASISQWLQQMEDQRNAPPLQLPPTVGGRTTVTPAGVPQPIQLTGPKTGQKSQEEQDRILAKIESQREPWYGHMTQALADYFNAEHRMLLHAIQGLDSLPAIKSALLTTQMGYAENLNVVLATYYTAIGEAAAHTIGYQFGQKATIFHKSTAGEMAPYVKSSVDWITATTQDHLSHLDAGNKEEMKTALADLYQGYQGNRAGMIAKNEVVLANNLGSHIAVKNLGIPILKTWLTEGDERVRPTHAQANGQQRTIDQPYDVGGYRFLFPKDNSGDPARDETVNCRCSEYYSSDPQLIQELLSGAQQAIEPYPDYIKDQDAYMRKYMGLEGLQKGQIKSIKQYAGGHYDSINSALREEEELSNDQQKIADDLDDLIAGSVVPTALQVFRGGESSFFDDLEVGAVIQDSAYVSTSLYKYVAQKTFADDVVFIINLNKGDKALYVEPYAHHEGEYELLLPRGTKFRVTKREEIIDLESDDQEDKWFITLELYHD
jgi:HK97 family phage portal protein